ncbi:MAG: hypothetical protein AAGA11_05360 [Pseudomonadota bacterium]
MNREIEREENMADLLALKAIFERLDYLFDQAIANMAEQDSPVDVAKAA